MRRDDFRLSGRYITEGYPSRAGRALVSLLPVDKMGNRVQAVDQCDIEVKI